MTAEESLRPQKINSGEWCKCDDESGEMLTKELNCMNCCIGNFKSNLCDCEDEFHKEFKCVGSGIDFTKKVMDRIRPKGKWDRDREIPNTCSVCGEDWDKYVYGQEVWYTGEIPNFCPNCGADMRGEEDD